jgi:hypothetical protein
MESIYPPKHARLFSSLCGDDTNLLLSYRYILKHYTISLFSQAGYIFLSTQLAQRLQ